MLPQNCRNYSFYFAILMCAGSQFINAQEIEKKSTNQTYDALVQPNNSGYFNGPEFQDIYLTNSNSDRYYMQFDFSLGSVSYRNQEYFDVLLKYDLYEDQVITQSTDDLNLFKVNLISKYISEFTIHGRKFVRIPELEELNTVKFYEVGYVGENLNLFIKHHKRKKETNINLTLRFDFISENYYVLYQNKSYQKFESIKDLKKILPDKEKQIRDYQKMNKTLYKSDLNQFMIHLIKHLDLQQNL